ncbi:MAG: hypothetical protein U1E15_13085 [Hyphomicrobiales bacterium]
MPRFSAFALLFQALLLTGCTVMPVSSMIALSKVDAMTSDLSRLRIALATPQALQPKPGGVHMDVVVSYGGQPPEKKLIRLEETATAADLVGLPTADKPGQQTHVFKLSQAGIAELTQIRQNASAAKAEKKKGSLSMGVSAKEFCLAAPLPQGPLYTTTWMLTSETLAYVELARNYDLRSDDTIAAGLKDVAPCAP